MTTDSQIAIERLDVDNYATWRSRMKCLLITRGLWAAIGGDRASSDTDMKAQALIGLCVKDHYLTMLEGCSSAKEAWEKLEQMYQSKSNARKLQLRKELSQIKMGPSEPLTKYVARAQEIQAQLRAAGHEVPDQEVAWSVLAGLPSAYDTVVTVLETTGDQEMSLEDIVPKLMQIEQRQPPAQRRADATALSATQRAGSTPYRRETRTCFYCGKPGHIKRDCQKRQEDEKRRAPAMVAL